MSQDGQSAMVLAIQGSLQCCRKWINEDLALRKHSNNTRNQEIDNKTLTIFSLLLLIDFINYLESRREWSRGTSDAGSARIDD